ncbi:MAG: hypothetical protein ABIU87_06385 [Ornithinibacter sp.]
MLLEPRLLSFFDRGARSGFQTLDPSYSLKTDTTEENHMGTHTASTTISGEIADAYTYLKNPANLPDYFPKMVEAKELEPGLVRTTADVDADQDGDEERVTSEAWFRTDDDAHSIAWGSTESEYRGELSLTEGQDQTTIALSVTTIHDIPNVQNGLEESLAAITRRLETASTG